MENQSKRANRNQKKYVCTGGHSDLAQPTTRRKTQYRPRKNHTKKEDKDSNNKKTEEPQDNMLCERRNDDKAENWYGCQSPARRKKQVPAGEKNSKQRRRQSTWPLSNSSPSKVLDLNQNQQQNSSTITLGKQELETNIAGCMPLLQEQASPSGQSPVKKKFRRRRATSPIGVVTTTTSVSCTTKNEDSVRSHGFSIMDAAHPIHRRSCGTILQDKNILESDDDSEINEPRRLFSSGGESPSSCATSYECGREQRMTDLLNCELQSLQIQQEYQEGSVDNEQYDKRPHAYHCQECTKLVEQVLSLKMEIAVLKSGATIAKDDSRNKLRQQDNLNNPPLNNINANEVVVGQQERDMLESMQEILLVEDKEDKCRTSKNENRSARRLRVQDENAEFSSKLSAVIHRFVMQPDLADRRKFPTARLGKIVVNAVVSIAWTQLELSKLRYDAEDKDGSARDMLSTLTDLVNAKMRRSVDKTKAAVLVECIWDETFLHGEVQGCMIEKVRQYLRNHVFTPWRILKAMDLAGFNLSLAGLEVLRQVDVAGKYSRGLIPSKSTILRSARKVETMANEFCPFKMIGRTFEEPNGLQDVANEHDGQDNEVGEGFEFDVVKVTETLFDAFGLMNEAKRRSVELAITSDGAQLTNTISHVAAGLKFNDMALCDPFTKQPLLLHGPDSLVQSRNLCFPLRIVIAKDSKKTLDGFRPLYNIFNSGVVAEALDCCPFKMSYPGDMKLQWGALDNGGAAKVKDFFCFICPCRSASLHVPHDNSKCSICSKRRQQRRMSDNDGGDDSQQEPDSCHHYEFLQDPEVRSKLNDELTILTSLLDEQGGHDAGPIDKNSTIARRMYVRGPAEAMVEGDKFDIDYEPTTATDKAAWAAIITEELGCRSLLLTGTLHERQQRLRLRLLNEKRCKELSDMLAGSAPKDQAMYLVLQAVVCILHLENRVGLKSIECILRSGLSNARQGILEWTTSNSANQRQIEYVRCITRIMQTQILGTVLAPSQWRFPLTEDGAMGTLSMDNNRTRLCVNSIELLIMDSFPNSDINKPRLLSCFGNYREALVILRKKTDVTDDEIAMFQCHIDAWFCDWVKVYGREGCTNYTHMLSSSHVMRYMQEWKCLYRFSQQGWEALNALIKSYFFRRTNRGGFTSTVTKKSKLLGIARWLQRRMMWYSGLGDSLFNDNLDDNLYQDEEGNDEEDNDEESDIDGDECSISSGADDLDDDDFESETFDRSNNEE